VSRCCRRGRLRCRACRYCCTCRPSGFAALRRPRRCRLQAAAAVQPGGVPRAATPAARPGRPQRPSLAAQARRAPAGRSARPPGAPRACWAPVQCQAAVYAQHAPAQARRERVRTHDKRCSKQEPGGRGPHSWLADGHLGPHPTRSTASPAAAERGACGSAGSCADAVLSPATSCTPSSTRTHAKRTGSSAAPAAPNARSALRLRQAPGALPSRPAVC